MLVSTLLALGLLGAPAPARWAGAVSALEKVRPGNVPRGEPAARLLLARGECEGIQVAVPPPVEQVDATVEPLANSKGRLEHRLYRVGYVPVTTPSNSEGAPGLWPDPLIPTEDAFTGESRSALPFDSTVERPLVLYVELCAPSTLAPGTYRGALTLTASGRPRQRVELSARVISATLPASSSLSNSFGISIYSIARGHGLTAPSTEASKLLRLYATALLSHRLSAYGMGIDPPPARREGGRLLVDFGAYDQELGPFLDGTALPSGARFTSTEVRLPSKSASDEEVVAYLRAYADHFRTKGWPVTLFRYAKDEPRPEDFALVRRQAEQVRRVQGVRLLVTSALQPELDGASDILCPPLNCFFPRKGLQTCSRVLPAQELHQRLGTGRKLWWYQSCNAHGCDHGPFEDPAVERAYSGWASYMVDHSALRNRAMGPLAYLAAVEGELYFDTVYAFHQGDPWEGVWAFGGNGDGTLFYPGTPERIGGKSAVPVESLRLKHIRDGLEDYEWLRLVDSRGAPELAREAARSLARSGYEIATSPKPWEQARERLANFLEGGRR